VRVGLGAGGVAVDERDARVGAVAQFMQTHPDAPVCGRVWRAAWNAGKVFGKREDPQGERMVLDRLNKLRHRLDREGRGDDARLVIDLLYKLEHWAHEPSRETPFPLPAAELLRQAEGGA